MAASGSISQSFDGKTLTYTDTSSGIGTVTGRVLNIYDSNGILLTTITMSGTTATYTISLDVALNFIETITVTGGGTFTVNLNFISTQFYNLAQANLVANPTACCDDCLTTDMVKAREFINAATTYYYAGDLTSCQFMLNSANNLITS